MCLRPRIVRPMTTRRGSSAKDAAVWAVNESCMRRLLIARCSPLLVAGALLASCSSEPCEYDEGVAVDSKVTPFADGQTAFSHCAACPPLQPFGTDPGGPATACDIAFSDGGGAQVPVACLYGPDGNISAGDLVDAVPNVYAFCTSYCPKLDYLRGCSIHADEKGVQSLACVYGRGSCDQ